MAAANKSAGEEPPTPPVPKCGSAGEGGAGNSRSGTGPGGRRQLIPTADWIRPDLTRTVVPSAGEASVVITELAMPFVVTASVGSAKAVAASPP